MQLFAPERRPSLAVNCRAVENGTFEECITILQDVPASAS